MDEVTTVFEQVKAIQVVPVNGFEVSPSLPGAPAAEYLSDEKGLYGIRINHPMMSMQVCIRPDKVNIPAYSQAWLHTIPRKTKESSIEEQMVNRLTETIRKTKYPQFDNVRRPGKELSKEDRKKYFAIPWYSRRIINGMWKKVLAECADKEALKLAKRFHISLRAPIYQAACQSLRARQLIEAFPVLGCKIYNNHFGGLHVPGGKAEIVEQGLKLKEIAEQMYVPLSMRKIKPGAVHGIIHASTECWKLFRGHPDIVHAYLPQQTMRQYRWLMLWTTHPFQTFGFWMLKNAPTDQKLRSLIEDAQLLRDWYNNGQFTFRLGPPLGDGAPQQLPTCSWETAKERSAEWHRTAAERFAAQQLLLNEEARLEALKPFPEPWLPGQVENTIGRQLDERPSFEIHEYSIVPLTTAAMLEEEGLRMHHCVAMYASYVKREECYIYSVRKGDKSIATLELCKVGQPKKQYVWDPPQQFFTAEQIDAFAMIPETHVKTRLIWEYGIRQMRGPCNAELHHSIKGLVNRWLEEGNRKCSESNNSTSTSQRDSEAAYSQGLPLAMQNPGLLGY